jgi:hypothetical protein
MSNAFIKSILLLVTIIIDINVNHMLHQRLDHLLPYPEVHWYEQMLRHLHAKDSGKVFATERFLIVGKHFHSQIGASGIKGADLNISDVMELTSQVHDQPLDGGIDWMYYKSLRKIRELARHFITCYKCEMARCKVQGVETLLSVYKVVSFKLCTSGRATQSDVY